MEKAILIQMIGMALFFSCYLLNTEINLINVYKPQ